MSEQKCSLDMFLEHTDWDGNNAIIWNNDLHRPMNPEYNPENPVEIRPRILFGNDDCTTVMERLRMQYEAGNTRIGDDARHDPYTSDFWLRDLGDKIQVHKRFITITYEQDSKDPNAWKFVNAEDSDGGMHFCSPAYTFDNDRAHPSSQGLDDENGWAILSAETHNDYCTWIEEVEAVKDRKEVEIDLSSELKGDKDAILDFLKSYKDSIHFWDYYNI
ncbi:hypothetical protein KY330_03905 [Candidatus Woesearchaeota archaeon]|nr:hypothetical protein [Candidatus Woesearchaeota archaeon]